MSFPRRIGRCSVPFLAEAFGPIRLSGPKSSGVRDAGARECVAQASATAADTLAREFIVPRIDTTRRIGVRSRWEDEKGEG